jgi:putative transposase
MVAKNVLGSIVVGDLHAYESVSEAKAGLQRYLTFYNQRRPHSSLDGQTPEDVYFSKLQQSLAA